jgi:hypothetical protein
MVDEKSSCTPRPGLGWALLLAVALGGCATQEAKDDAQLQEIVQLLPGHYDNSVQVQSDIQRGVHPPHDELSLDISLIVAPMIGEHVFYMQENVSGDPRRITSQKVLMFGVIKKEIVETVQSFSEPQRWRNGHLNPELFTSLLATDVHSTKGCSLRWKKTAERFVAANEPKTCHGPSRGSVGLAQLDLRAELGPEELALAELAFDASGHLVLGRQDEPFYRFRKQSRDSDSSGSNN